MITCKKAGREHISVIGTMVTDCIHVMESQGIFQWDSVYPTVNDFLADLADETLFVVCMDEAVAGCITINEVQCTEYESCTWRDATFMVVHRLLVAPMFQRAGIGRFTMLFAESLSRENGKTSIRLDAFTRNPAAVRLYRRLGYEERGNVLFCKGEFYLFEKLL